MKRKVLPAWFTLLFLFPCIAFGQTIPASSIKKNQLASADTATQGIKTFAVPVAINPAQKGIAKPGSLLFQLGNLSAEYGKRWSYGGIFAQSVSLPDDGGYYASYQKISNNSSSYINFVTGLHAEAESQSKARQVEALAAVASVSGNDSVTGNMRAVYSGLSTKAGGARFIQSGIQNWMVNRFEGKNHFGTLFTAGLVDNNNTHPGPRAGKYTNTSVDSLYGIYISYPTGVTVNNLSHILEIEDPGSTAHSIYAPGGIAEFGSLKINSLANGTPGADSILVIQNAIVKKLAQSAIAGANGIQCVHTFTANGQTTTTSDSYKTPDDGTPHTYQVSAKVAITAIKTARITVTVSYTDNSTNGIVTNTFYNMNGSAGMNAAGYSNFPVMGELNCKPNTAITITAVCTGISASFNLNDSIVRII